LSKIRIFPFNDEKARYVDNFVLKIAPDLSNCPEAIVAANFTREYEPLLSREDAIVYKSLASTR
jgi:hypothetical protein